MTLTLLDPIGAAIALLATYQFTKASFFAWPISLIAITINSYLYWQKGIYGHVGLECIYLMSTLYGWYLWIQRGPQNDHRPIRNMPQIGYSCLLIAGPILFILFSKGLQRYFNSDIPSWDAATTLLALTAQYMLCRKWIECWVIWFVVDALVVGLHLYKEIPFHAASHALYLGLAVLGYIRWKKIKAKQLTASPSSHQQVETQMNTIA